MRYKVAMSSFFANRQMTAALKLVAAWLVGTVLGAYIGSSVNDAFASYFLVACSSNITILGLACIHLIPLLFTVCLGYLFSKDAILLVVVLKAVAFALVSVLCVGCWGSAGWLVSRLFLFSDYLSAPVLIWIWYRALCKKLDKREIVISFFLMLGIAVADFLFITPFLCSLS